MNYLAPIPKQFVDHSGVPYSDGTVTVYLHGSTARANLYASASGDALSPNPVVLDSNGAWKAYVKPIAGYDYVVKDKEGNVVFSYENVAVPIGSDTGISMIASEYSAEGTYPSGTLVTHLGLLYISKVDIDEPEEWEPLHWEETTVADCMPILFECTEPGWPDAGLMYEAVRAGKFAGINRLSSDGESRRIWTLVHIVDKTDSPENHAMQFRLDDDSSTERVEFSSQDCTHWTIFTMSTQLAIRYSVAKNWDANDVSYYHAGTLRYKDGMLYRCLTDTPSSTWEYSEWALTTVVDEIPNIPAGDKVWAHWENDGNWHDVTGWYTFPNSDYHKSEGELTDSQYPYLKAGLYRFTMEVALRNYPTAYDAVQKFDITIKYGAQSLRAQSFMFDRTIPYGDGIVETVWFGGIFRMPAGGAVSVYVESPDNLPAEMKCSHIFINKLGD